MAAARVCVPRVISSYLLLLWEALQDQQVDLTRAPRTLLLLPWVPEYVRFFMHPFRVDLYFPQPSCSPKSKPTSLQRQTFWELIFQVQDPQAGEPDVGSDSLLLEENLCSCNYPCLWVAHPVVWILTIPHLCSSYLSRWGSFFISLVVEDLFY